MTRLVARREAILRRYRVSVAKATWRACADLRALAPDDDPDELRELIDDDLMWAADDGRHVASDAWAAELAKGPPA